MSTPTQFETELFDARRGPGDDMPLTNALYRIIIDTTGMLLWQIRIVPQDGYTCSAVFEVSKPDGSARKQRPVPYEQLLKMLTDYARKKGCNVAPSIFYHRGRFCVLPVEPFLPPGTTGSAPPGETTASSGAASSHPTVDVSSTEKVQS